MLTASITAAFVILGSVASASAMEITLGEAIERANGLDPWLLQSQEQQLALEAQSNAAHQYPDPKISVGLANLPLDTFDFGQEGMTQFKIGAMQMLPRGETRVLRKRRLEHLAASNPFLRADRRAKNAVTVAKLYLSAYKSEATIRLIENNRVLFEQLVDNAELSYSTARGKTRQQDLLRAQLELTRLEDRLTRLAEMRDTAQATLMEWLVPEGKIASQFKFKLSSTLPDLVLTPRGEVAGESISIENQLMMHPIIVGIDQKIQASRTSVDLAKQSYKPQWSFNAAYAYREDDPMGRDSADLFSVGMTVEVPIFGSVRQDELVNAAVASTNAVKIQKVLAIRKMAAAFRSHQQRLQRLDERDALYQERLLKEIHAHSEATLNAYSHDEGDFAEVVRARIAELDAEIAALDIAVERQKVIAQINYFFADANDTGVSHE